MKICKLKNPVTQKGSVLILSLIILVVLTMLGVSSMSSSSLQEKMSGNFRDREVAFQAAEMSLTFAENYVSSDINTANISGNGLYTKGNGPTSRNAFTGNATVTYWWSGTDSITLSQIINEVRIQPRYTIEVREQVGESDGTNINIGGYGESTGGGEITSFRITARATGKSNNTVVILQSNYGKRL